MGLASRLVSGSAQAQGLQEVPGDIAGAGALLVFLIGRRISLSKKNKQERELELVYRYNLLAD